MTAKEFWESFEKQIKEDKDELIAVWDSSSKNSPPKTQESKAHETEFTLRIKTTISNAIKNVVNVNSKYKTQTEYYRIDLIGWEQKKDEEIYSIKDGIENYRLNKHAWNFDIAVEHENNYTDWSDEIVKLAYVFCDLRVVIGYFPYVSDESEKQKMQLKYLNVVAKTVNDLNCKDNMNHGEFMVILGDVGGNEADGFRKLVYTPYIYKYNQEQSIGEFVLLLDEKN